MKKYNYDGLNTVHNHDFMEDQSFKDAYNFAAKVIGKDYKWYWRNYIGIKLASNARKINMNFVELGVGEGFMTTSIVRYFQKTFGQLPHFHLFDTFNGIDTEIVSQKEIDHWGVTVEQRRDKYKTHICPKNVLEARLKKNFEDTKNFKFIKGSVPNSINQGVISSLKNQGGISFMHIDMNNATPEREALKILYPLVAKGGFILFDDYGFKGLEFQKNAINETCKKLDICNPITLPTGQGLLIKMT